MDIAQDQLIRQAEIEQKIGNQVGLNKTLAKLAATDRANPKYWTNLAKSFALIGNAASAQATLQLFVENNTPASNHDSIYETGIELGLREENYTTVFNWTTKALRTGYSQIALSAIDALSLAFLSSESEQIAEFFENSEITDARVLFRLIKRLIDANARSTAQSLFRLIPEIEQNSPQGVRIQASLLGSEPTQSDSLSNAEYLESDWLQHLSAKDQNKVLQICYLMRHRFAENQKSIETVDRCIALGFEPKETSRISFFFAHYSDGYSPEDLREKALQFQNTLALNLKKKPIKRTQTKPLRVGFISANYSAHPVGWMTAGFFCEAKKLANEVSTIIFDSSPKSDFVAKTIRTAATEYLDISKIPTDQDLVEQINNQNLDVLVDLDGLSVGNRIEAVLNQNAPVVKWVGGLIGSSYLEGVTYLVTDIHQTPSEFDTDYSETLIRMTNTYVTYTPPPYNFEVLEPPSTATGYATFGCFNNAAKISPRCIKVWSEILLRTPNSKLTLKDRSFSEVRAQQNVLAMFLQNGVDGARITFKGGSSHQEHIQMIQYVDICLDPMPYSGGLSTLEAAYVGVPVISLPGRILAHRHSASHLQSLGTPELIAKDESHYVDLAVNLASDPARVLAYRSHLRNALYGGPLMDHAGFTQEFIKKMAAIN